MENTKEKSHRNFSDYDFQRVYDFLGSVRTSLLLDGININYDLPNSLETFKDILQIYFPEYTVTPVTDRKKARVGITNKSLRYDSSITSLFFPWSSEIGDVVFTKTHNKYRVKQEFHLGAILNNRDYFESKEFLEEVFRVKIEEGEEWKLKKFQQEVLLYSVADAMDLSRELMKKLIKGRFYELNTDIDTLAEEVVEMDPSVNYPLLNHKFGWRNRDDVYMGTRIMLGEEVLKHLRDSSLLENLVKYHQFLNELTEA